VANHLSCAANLTSFVRCLILMSTGADVDVLVCVALFCPRFLAKVADLVLPAPTVAQDSIRRVPFWGWLSQQVADCVYTDAEAFYGAAAPAGTRRHVGCVARLVGAQRGGERPVLVFPEGTTTNGAFVGTRLSRTAVHPLSPVSFLPLGRLSGWPAVPARGAAVSAVIERLLCRLGELSVCSGAGARR
jgi:1-acyl-sn-glycerol-3-phosphate acyltransferase